VTYARPAKHTARDPHVVGEKMQPTVNMWSAKAFSVARDIVKA